MVGASRKTAVRGEGSDRSALATDDGRPTVLLFDRHRAERLAGVDDLPKRLGGSKLLWIDIPEPSEDAARSVVSALDLDDDARRGLASTSRTPSFRDAGRYVHLTIHSPDGNGSHELTEIECLIADNWVVTAHERPVAVLDQFAELASGSGPTGELDGPSFVAALLEWVLNEYSTAFDHLEERLEEVDERAMQGKRRPEDEIEHLVDLRRRAARLRRSLAAHRPLILALTHPELEALGDSTSARRFQALLVRYPAFQSRMISRTMIRMTSRVPAPTYMAFSFLSRATTRAAARLPSRPRRPRWPAQPHRGAQTECPRSAPG